MLEANVYGVESRAATAAPAWRRSSAGSDFDLAALRDHLVERLPDYARPVFLRLRDDIDVTATFKQRKIDLVKEGFDPVASDDPIYFNDPHRECLRASRPPALRSHPRRRHAAVSESDRAPATGDVLAFWRAAGPDKWFNKDAAFDAEIARRFLPTYEAAAAGRSTIGRRRPKATLALLIVLDQFPRNMFRGDARTFATDPIARAVAEPGGRARLRCPHHDAGTHVLLSAVRAFGGARRPGSAASNSIAPAATPTA